MFLRATTVVAKINMNTNFLLLSSSTFLRKWTKTPDSLVVLYLDKFFKYLDKLFKAEASPCRKIGISETLHVRQKKLKEMIDLLEFVGKLLNKNKGFYKAGYANFENQKKVCVNPCNTRMKINDPKLHVTVKEASYKDHYEDQYLDFCTICGKSLHNSDIFLYMGKPFCSTECRQEQMEIDEVREKKLRFDTSLRKSNYRNSMPYEIVPVRIVTVS